MLYETPSLLTLTRALINTCLAGWGCTLWDAEKMGGVVCSVFFFAQIINFFFFWLYQALVAAVACGIFPCSMQALQHEGSVVVMRELTSPTGDWTKFPALEGRFLTTGLPGKFPNCCFKRRIQRMGASQKGRPLLLSWFLFICLSVNFYLPKLMCKKCLQSQTVLKC